MNFIFYAIRLYFVEQKIKKKMQQLRALNAKYKKSKDARRLVMNLCLAFFYFRLMSLASRKLLVIRVYAVIFRKINISFIYRTSE